jgi:hypothetical protein
MSSTNPSNAGLARPETKRGRGQRVVLDLLRQHAAMDDGLPTSATFLFYEAEQAGNATKDGGTRTRRSRGWPPGRQDVTDYAFDLRDRGVIPWGWIVDESRTITEWDYAATVAKYMAARLPMARINPWGDGEPPLVICESRATAGVLDATVSRYVCPVTGTAGMAHGFLVTRVAPLLMGNERRVFYLGDLDLSGNHIEANTQRVLERAAGRALDWTRLGMLAEQAEGITPIHKRDRRYNSGAPHLAIEVEALGQARVIALVRDALEALLPEPLADVQERERQERAVVERLLNGEGER